MKSRWIGLFFVVIFSVFLAVRQYRPGTILMGWDSLHPEFNYKLAFERVLSGAWRESQGVGAVSIHSHMSELPRIATLWTLDLFLPMRMIRWTYMLLMLVLGIVGAYVLFVHILSRIKRSVGMGWGTLVAIAGSFVYLFNLSTLHHFLVPFEMFIALFGLLPWSLWSVSRYFEVSNRARLLTLLVIQFFLSSCAFAATLWIVYYGVFVLTTWFLASNKKRWTKVQVLTLLINAYWLLPTMYGLFSTSRIVESAKINQIFSPEAWLNNVGYGTIPQVLRLESFILQWLHFDYGNKMFDLVVHQWLTSSNMQHINLALSLVSGVVVLGLIRFFYLSLIKRNRESSKWSGLVLIGILLFVVMLSQVWPISVGISWARQHLPLIGELLRTPFTKISIPLQLVYAILISLFLLWVVEKVRFVLLRVMVLLVVVGLIIYPFVSWITKGNLIGDVVVTHLPQEYIHLFTATKEMRAGRMVALPIPNMWGWEYRDWGNGEGYEGANFTQFGIAQSLLIRDFDRWSPYNETFYDQLSTALYGDDTQSLQQVLAHYDVQYVLIDESVIAPGQDSSILRIDETKQLAEELGWEPVFREGFLTVYEIPVRSDLVGSKNSLQPTRSDLGVTAPKSYTVAAGEVVYGRKDVIYQDLGTYVTKTSDAIMYPFAGLMNEEIKGVEYGEDKTAVSSPATAGRGSELWVPGFRKGEMVEMSYKQQVVAGKLQIDWEPIYRVGTTLPPKDVFDVYAGPVLPTFVYPVSSSQDSIWVSVGAAASDSQMRTSYLKGNEVVSGKVTLKVGEPIVVRVYAGQGKVEMVKMGVQQPCGDQEQYQCWSGSLAKAQQDSLVQTITHYQGDVSPEMCLDLEGDPYACVNEIRQSTSPIVVLVPTAKGQRYWLDSVVRDGNTQLGEVGVVRYPQIIRDVMGEEWWNGFLPERVFNLQGQALQVEVGGEPRVYDFGKVGKRLIENCDVLKRGTANKSQSSDRSPIAAQGSELLGTDYAVDGRGAACDYIDMIGLDSQLSYLMHVQGENKLGRSLKFFLYNTGSQRNDLEYLLNKGKFDQTFTLLPWEFAGKYSLHIETRSFGERAENMLQPVEARYFPVREIAGAKLVPQSSDHSPITAQGSELSSLQITGVKKTGTWLYKVNTEGVGLLRLSQGYDAGWIAISIRNLALLEHVKVDGWANGWILRQAQDGLIFIFYWPQLLEYFGFGILAATLFGIVIFYKSNRKG